jgi:hypothetical protein
MVLDNLALKICDARTVVTDRFSSRYGLPLGDEVEDPDRSVNISAANPFWLSHLEDCLETIHSGSVPTEAFVKSGQVSSSDDLLSRGAVPSEGGGKCSTSGHSLT